MTILYGIRNCDTVKKACKWLDQHNVSYQFHDFREAGIDKDRVAKWIDQLGWETVVNKRSTTWKQLSPSDRDAMNAERAITAIVDNPTLVKRPLLEKGAHFSTGFKADQYEQLFL